MPKAMQAAADGSQQPAAPLAERASGTATEQLEVAVHRRQRLSLGVAEDEAAPDQDPAERHDERRHADVGDDEPLDGADPGTEGDPDRQRDDPRVPAIEPEAERVGDPLGLDHRHRVADEPELRADRQVDVARHDDQHHARRHDGDRDALDRQVPEVARRQEVAARQDVEAHPDDRPGRPPCRTCACRSRSTPRGPRHARARRRWADCRCGTDLSSHDARLRAPCVLRQDCWRRTHGTSRCQVVSRPWSRRGAHRALRSRPGRPAGGVADRDRAGLDALAQRRLVDPARRRGRRRGCPG